MNDLDEHDEQVEGDEQQAPSGDEQSTPEPNVERDEDVTETGAEADVEQDADVEPEAITDLGDDADVTPADAVADSLREALGSMREEADRIATLGTGDEQVAAAEQFAEDAGKLDEQVGAAARSADADD